MRGGIGWPVVRKAENAQSLFLLLGEKARMRAGVKTNFVSLLR
jgi:hypothetical protein